MTKGTLLAATLLSVGAFASAQAQDKAASPAAELARQPTVDLKTWNQTGLYNGWNTDEFFDATIIGQNGEEMGDAEVVNIFMNRDGKVTRLLVDVGGFLGIADRFVSVPFEQVRLDPNGQRITLPVTADNAETFRLFADDSSVQDTRYNEYRAYDLLNDYVQLAKGEGYGIVRDLVFSSAGQLQALVVSPDVNAGVSGVYAYPYYAPYANGYDLRDPYYRLPYGESDLRDYEPFDYGRMGS